MASALSTPIEDLEHVARFVDWSPLRNMSLFLTGGTGFIGRWIVDSLCYANEHQDLNATITILTRSVSALRTKAPELVDRKGVYFVQGDVRTYSLVRGFTHVIHAAGDRAHRGNELGCTDVFEAIVNGTQRVSTFTSASLSARMLYVSSGAVYGRQPAEMRRCSESYTGAPSTHILADAYGMAKRAAETACCVTSRLTGCEIVVARCFGAVGPHLDPDAADPLCQYLRNAVRREPITVCHEASNFGSYLYAADLAIWLLELLGRGPSRDPVNVGSDEDVCLQDLARLVVNICAPDLPVRVVSDVAAEPKKRYVPETLKARGLGLVTRIGLEDAIARTFQWTQRSVTSRA